MNNLKYLQNEIVVNCYSSILAHSKIPRGAVAPFREKGAGLQRQRFMSIYSLYGHAYR